MPASFALSWYRPPYWASRLGKRPGRVVSNYPSLKYEDVSNAAAHINSIDPEMDCQIEVFNS